MHRKENAQEAKPAVGGFFTNDNILANKNFNIAIALFNGDGTENNPSHLYFSTWYHPDICHYLLHMINNQAQCIRVIFDDAGYGNNTTTFKNQIKCLMELSDQLNKPALFISKEPGAQNHFIWGLVRNAKLFLSNPLGIRPESKCYKILAELKQEKIIQNVWLSNTRLQWHEYEEELVSCGAITLELALHVISDFTLERLNTFWDDFKINTLTVHKASHLKYYSLSLEEFSLPDSLMPLSAPFNKVHYKEAVCKIRKKHGNLLKSLTNARAQRAEIAENGYLTQCKNECPAQVVFLNLLTEHEHIDSIQKLKEFNLLIKSLQQPEEKIISTEGLYPISIKQKYYVDSISQFSMQGNEQPQQLESFESLIQAYFKPLINYAKGESLKDDCLSEPLWLYRLQVLEAQSLLQQLEAQLKFHSLGDKAIIAKGILLIHDYESCHSFDTLKNVEKKFLMNILAIASKAQDNYSTYATSLLITFLMRSQKKACREAALKLLKGNAQFFKIDTLDPVHNNGDLKQSLYQVLEKSFIDIDETSRIYVDFSYAIFTNNLLHDIIFRGQFLLGAKFNNVKLENKNFQYACLQQANLSSAILTHCDFSGADLSQAILDEVILKDNCLFEATNFAYASLKSITRAKTASFRKANFHHTNLENANLKETKCDYIFWTQAKVKGVDFTDVDLSGAIDLQIDQLSTARCLKNAKLDIEVFSIDEFLKLRDEGCVFNSPSEECITEDSQFSALVDKERVDYSSLPPIWPPRRELWYFDKEWNSSRSKDVVYDIKSSKLDAKFEEPLFRLIEHLVYATSDYESYKSTPFEYARFKKALEGGKTKEFIKIPRPQHLGQRASITIKSIKIIHNEKCWSLYQDKKKELRNKPVSTIKLSWHGGQRLAAGLPMINKNVNECWLFHGTSLETMKKITQNGFSTKFASNSGLIGYFTGYGALGKGVYCSDNFAKVSTYIACPTCKQNQCDCKAKKRPLKAVFLSRVLLGNVYVDKYKSRKNAEGPPEGYDSCWGPAKAFDFNSSFDCNEFIVGDERKIYPEFCIFYYDNPLNIAEAKISSKVPSYTEFTEFPMLAIALKDYHRLAHFDRLEQQLYCLSTLGDILSEIWISEEAKTYEKKLNSLRSCIKKERNNLYNRKNQELNLGLTNLAPTYCDVWLHFYLKNNHPEKLISLCNILLNCCQSQAWYYWLRALGYYYLQHKNLNPDVIYDINCSYIMDEEKTRIFFRSFREINEIDYCLYSLDLLAHAHPDSKTDFHWLNRLKEYTWGQFKTNEYTSRKLWKKWQIYYLTLTTEEQNEFRIEFFERAQFENLAECNVELWRELINLPDNTGMRGKIKIDRNEWDQQWQQILQDGESPATVNWLSLATDGKSYELKTKFLSQVYIDQLIDLEDGYPRCEGKEKSGRSLVKLLRDNESNPLAFAKFYPRYPLRQFSFNGLSQRLSGYAATTTLINLRINHKKRKFGYPILLSQPVGNVKKNKATLLKYQLKGKYQDIVRNLNRDAFFWKYLEVLILCYSDDKRDNLGVVSLFQKHKKEFQLVSFDTDEGFENEMATCKKPKVFSEVLLFDLAFKEKGWSKIASAFYQNYDIFELIKAWLDEVERFTAAIPILFTEIERNRYLELSKKAEFSNDNVTYNLICHVDQLFRMEDLPRLYERMLRVQLILQNLQNDDRKKPYYITEQLNSLLSCYYRSVFERPNTLESERFEHLQGVRDQFDHEKMLIDTKKQAETVPKDKKQKNRNSIKETAKEKGKEKELELESVPARTDIKEIESFKKEKKDILLPQTFNTIIVSASKRSQPQSWTDSFLTTTPFLPQDKNSICSYARIKEQRLILDGLILQYKKFSDLLSKSQEGDFQEFERGENTTNYLRERVLKVLRWNWPLGKSDIRVSRFGWHTEKITLQEKLLRILASCECPYLRISELHENISEEKIIRIIPAMTYVTEIVISNSPQLKANFLTAITKCRSLTKLTLFNFNCGETSEKKVLKFKQLRILKFDHYRATSFPFEVMSNVLEELQIGEFVKLEKICINEKEILIQDILDLKKMAMLDVYEKIKQDQQSYFNALISREKKRKLLDGCKLSEFNGNMNLALKIIKDMVELNFFTDLNFSNTSILRIDELKKILKSSLDLKKLNLDNCLITDSEKNRVTDLIKYRKVDNRDFNLIFEYCPSLEYLNLNCSDITYFGQNFNLLGVRGGLRDSYNGILENEKRWLLKLELKNCIHLKFINFSARYMQILEVENCIRLQIISLQSPNLHSLYASGCLNLNAIFTASHEMCYLDISHCKLLEDHGLFGLTTEDSLIQEINSENCDKLTYRNLLEYYPILACFPLEYLKPILIMLELQIHQFPSNNWSSIKYQRRKQIKEFLASYLGAYVLAVEGFSKVLLNIKNNEVRLAGIKALGKMGYCDQKLLSLLTSRQRSDKEEEIRVVAVSVLESMFGFDGEINKNLENSVNFDDSQNVKIAARKALIARKSKSYEMWNPQPSLRQLKFLKLLKESQKNIKKNFNKIENFNAEELIGILVNYKDNFDDLDLYLSIAVIFIANNHSVDKCIEFLVKALGYFTTTDAAIRIHVLSILGVVALPSDKLVIKKLVSIIKDSRENKQLTCVALKSLAKILSVDDLIQSINLSHTIRIENEIILLSEAIFKRIVTQKEESINESYNEKFTQETQQNEAVPAIEISIRYYNFRLGFWHRTAQAPSYSSTNQTAFKSA